ncbi:MAG: PBP1A family penicillin-binding protein [Bacilli bacterium]|nr:PBP1A family penicillin-binding protein [Bacilli bacterium]
MKFLKKFFTLIFFALISFVLFNAGAFIYAKITPKLEIEMANKLFFYDNKNNLFSQGSGRSEWIKLEDISIHLVNATLATEDKNFYTHNGFDYLRILKAVYVNLRQGAIVQGASTISQQYVKNLFLDFNKSWERKFEEFWLTYELEAHYDKEKILEGYLNTINYGHGVLGIENASRFYFNKSASDLTLAEASMLAGIPKHPSRFSPLVDELEAKKRQSLILSMMVRTKYITEEEMNNAFSMSLTYIGDRDHLNLSTVMYYQDAVLRELKGIGSIPPSFIESGGLKVYTNLDIKAQTALENSIHKNLINNPEIEVASVMIEPNSGKIIALTGGQDYNKSPYNRATQSKRQIGSIMKPILYYAALENGFTPSTSFISEPTTFTFSENQTYSPRNYNDIYPNSPISLALALAYSDNIYAIKTHLFLGVETLVDISKRIGIKEELDSIPSLPLGTEEINIIDLISGYSAFANEGYKIEPYLINKVEDTQGKILYEKKIVKEPVLNKSLTYILNEMMANSYDFSLIDYNVPTCLSIAPKLTNKYAIKSGTTNTDLWAVGYNKDIIIGVWAGYDQNKKIPKEEFPYAKNIWVDAIEDYLSDIETDWYDMPDKVVGVLVDPFTGKLATKNTKRAKILYYLKGTEPFYDNHDYEPIINIKE